MARSKKNIETKAENMGELEKLRETIAYHERCIEKAKAKIEQLEKREKNKQVKAVLESMSPEEIAAKLGIKL